MKRRRKTNPLRVVCALAMTVSVALLSGCASSKVSSVSPTIAGKVMRPELGTVVSIREVTIDGEATLLGQSTGAILGGGIGQTIGQGDGRVLASAGSAAVGAIVGGMVEKELSKKKAQQITISLDDGHTVVVVQELDDVGFREGDRVNVMESMGGDARVHHAQYESDGLY